MLINCVHNVYNVFLNYKLMLIVNTRACTVSFSHLPETVIIYDQNFMTILNT